MPEKELPRRGKRRGEPTPPPTVDEEDLSLSRGLLQEMNRVLNAAVDEDAIREKYWREYSFESEWQKRGERIMAERDRDWSRERAIAKQDALDRAYTEIGSSMIAMLKQHGTAVVKFGRQYKEHHEVISLDVYNLHLFPNNPNVERGQQVIAILEKDPKNFFKVWKSTDCKKEGFRDIRITLLRGLDERLSQVFQSPWYSEGHGYLHHAEENILLREIAEVVAVVPESISSPQISNP